MNSCIIIIITFFYHSRQQTPTRHNSIFDTRHSQTLEENSRISPFNSRRHKSLHLPHTQNINISQQPMNAWSHLKEHHSDAESTTSRSLPGSPSNSPTSSRKQGNIQRAQSLELVSSDDGENKDDGRSRNGEIVPFTFVYDLVYVNRKTQKSKFFTSTTKVVFLNLLNTNTNPKNYPINQWLSNRSKFSFLFFSFPFLLYCSLLYFTLLSSLCFASFLFPFLFFPLVFPVLLCCAMLCLATLAMLC